jgi:hypothetical protein
VQPTVAEESETKIQAVGNAIEAENPLPASPDGESRAQIALAFDSTGNHEIVAEVPGDLLPSPPERSSMRAGRL